MNIQQHPAGLRFGSVCSGIEAASVAWAPLGWSAEWFAEVEPFPSAVLAHHYPDTPNLGDMTTIARRVLVSEVAAPDVLCGGTPCQAFSVAGLRESLADERGNLTLKFVELADAIDHVRGLAGRAPSIVFWENVPGVLSTKDNAFGCFLAGLAGEDEPLRAPGEKWANSGAVYGPTRTVAWRTLDAQYFGLAQRRRRVFVVASARNDFDPATVLFEWDGLRRDTAPSRETGQEVAGRAAAGAGGRRHNSHWNGGVHPPLSQASQTRCGGIGSSNQEIFEQGGAGLVPTLAKCLLRGVGQRYDTDTDTDTILPHATHSLRGEGFDASEDGTGRGTPLVPVAFPANLSGTQCASAEDLAPSMGAANPTAVAVGADCWNGSLTGDVAATMGTRGSSETASGPTLLQAMQVRRLTPVECERLQGFPDGYTAIPWRKKPASECPDGPRYKALGNSWPVPVVTWLGRRIALAISQQ